MLKREETNIARDVEGGTYVPYPSIEIRCKPKQYLVQHSPHPVWVVILSITLRVLVSHTGAEGW